MHTDTALLEELMIKQGLPHDDIRFLFSQSMLSCHTDVKVREHTQKIRRSAVCKEVKSKCVSKCSEDNRKKSAISFAFKA